MHNIHTHTPTHCVGTQLKAFGELSILVFIPTFSIHNTTSPPQAMTPRPTSPSQTSTSSCLSNQRKISATRKLQSMYTINTLLPSPSPSAAPTSTPVSLHLLVPPLEGIKLIEKFLIVTLQLETLKQEWGLRVMDKHAITTAKQCQMLEDAFRENVVGVARKWVAKQQLHELTKMQMENVRKPLLYMCTQDTQENICSPTGGDGGHIISDHIHDRDQHRWRYSAYWEPGNTRQPERNDAQGNTSICT